MCERLKVGWRSALPQQLPYYQKITQGKLFDAGFAINSTVNTHIFNVTMAFLNICGFTVLLMTKPTSNNLH